MLQSTHCYQMSSITDDGSQDGLADKAKLFSNEENHDNDIVTKADLRLLAEWAVPNLIGILTSPEEYIDQYTDDYIRFHERAGQIIESLLSTITPEMLTVRFGVSGIVTDLNVPFELNESFLQNLWRCERPISHWIKKESDELMEVALLGRPFALASAAHNVQKISGMDRLEAIENNCYDAYLRQIYLRAFNLYGIYPLAHEKLGILGIDPWMQVVAGKDINPAHCTGRQLELYAGKQFRDSKIPFEVYSILKHLPLLVSITERLAITDWDTILQKELSASWMRGETGKWIEKALELLSDSENSGAQIYMLGA